MRKSNKETVFSIGDRDSFVFSDNLLYFNIFKTSKYVFGLGERNYQFLLNKGMKNNFNFRNIHFVVKRCINSRGKWKTRTQHL